MLINSIKNKVSGDGVKSGAVLDFFLKKCARLLALVFYNCECALAF